MKFTFKYKGNALTVTSSSSKDESRELATRIFRALKSVKELQDKAYTLELDIEKSEPEEPIDKSKLKTPAGEE